MQAEYPKKLLTASWDTLNVEYPVQKFPGTGSTSETLGRRWRGQPEVMKNLKEPINEIQQYIRDYNITKKCTRPVTNLDYGFKIPETIRFNKHTSSTENHYIYPLSRKIEDRPASCTAHGTTEMKSSYQEHTVPARLVTGKDQYKHPRRPGEWRRPDPLELEPGWHKDLEPLDTTHEGYEKYLDPYLTTSRLHHRPYTADQLSRPSASKDIVTYYTLADVPWVRSPKPEIDDWRLPISRPKSMYDRETFKEDCREIRTHNRIKCVPGAYRTEVRDNYTEHTFHPGSRVRDDGVRTYYERFIANLPNVTPYEDSTVKQAYTTENSHIGSGMPLCSTIDQFSEKNKRLESKSIPTYK